MPDHGKAMLPLSTSPRLRVLYPPQVQYERTNVSQDRLDYSQLRFCTEATGSMLCTYSIAGLQKVWVHEDHYLTEHSKSKIA